MKDVFSEITRLHKKSKSESFMAGYALGVLVGSCVAVIFFWVSHFLGSWPQ